MGRKPSRFLSADSWYSGSEPAADSSLGTGEDGVMVLGLLVAGGSRPRPMFQHRSGPPSRSSARTTPRTTTQSNPLTQDGVPTSSGRLETSAFRQYPQVRIFRPPAR